jgi:hypothetical protein
MYGKVLISNMMRIKKLNYLSLNCNKNTSNVSNKTLWACFGAS